MTSMPNTARMIRITCNNFFWLANWNRSIIVRSNRHNHVLHAIFIRFIFHMLFFVFSALSVRTTIANGFSREIYRFSYLLYHSSIIRCSPRKKNAMLFSATLIINLRNVVRWLPFRTNRIAYFCVATRRLADIMYTDMMRDK